MRAVFFVIWYCPHHQHAHGQELDTSSQEDRRARTEPLALDGQDPRASAKVQTDNRHGEIFV